MGELLRRYWHPVGLAARRDRRRRAQVRVLGEDLILFRDSARPPRPRRPALRAPRHLALLRPRRGARHPLLLPRLAVRRRTATASSSRASPTAARQRERIRQPWYPVEERYGLVFAYLGPPERKPVLPRYDALERLDDGRVRRGRRPQHRRRRPRRSFPATGSSTTRTWSTRSTCRSCTARSAAPSSSTQMGADARGHLGRPAERGVKARRRPPAARRQGPPPHQRGGAADPAGDPEPARGPVRPGRVDRLGAADRRHELPHLHRGPRAGSRRAREACARA